MVGKEPAFDPDGLRDFMERQAGGIVNEAERPQPDRIVERGVGPEAVENPRVGVLRLGQLFMRSTIFYEV